MEEINAGKKCQHHTTRGGGRERKNGPFPQQRHNDRDEQQWQMLIGDHISATSGAIKWPPCAHSTVFLGGLKSFQSLLMKVLPKLPLVGESQFGARRPDLSLLLLSHGNPAFDFFFLSFFFFYLDL